MGKGTPKIRAEDRTGLVQGKSLGGHSCCGRDIEFNFSQFDTRQGQRPSEWEKDSLLAKLFERFRDVSRLQFPHCFSQKFKKYEWFPEHGDFSRPDHIQDDAIWACL